MRDWWNLVDTSDLSSDAERRRVSSTLSRTKDETESSINKLKVGTPDGNVIGVRA